MISVPYTLFLIFTIAIVLCVIVQTFVLVGLALTVKKSVAGIGKLVKDVDAKAMPILVQTRTVLEDLTPKVRTLSANLVEMSTTLKDQTKHVNSTVGDVVDKTRHQAERVDEMVSAILNGVSHAGATIQAGVAKPARQVSGIIQGLRAGIDSFFSKRKPVYTHSTVVEEVPVHADRVDTPDF